MKFYKILEATGYEARRNIYYITSLKIKQYITYGEFIVQSLYKNRGTLRYSLTWKILSAVEDQNYHSFGNLDLPSDFCEIIYLDNKSIFTKIDMKVIKSNEIL